MFVNKPASTSQSSQSEIDQAHCNGASVSASASASASAVEPSATASNAVARPAAAASLTAHAFAQAAMSGRAAGAGGAVVNIPHIPFHLLCNDDGTAATGTTATTAATATATAATTATSTATAAPDAPKAAFVASSDNDTLGIIAGYLPQADQLVMRDVDVSVRAVVDPAIHTLKLSAHEACTLLRQPNALSNLRVLHLTDCNDPALIDLAATLLTMPKTRFELVLEAGMLDRDRVTADGVRPFVALPLLGLTLKNVPVPAEMSQVLACSMTPISINLTYFCSRSKVHEISQIPMLRSLQVGFRTVTPETMTIDALRSHAVLETLHIDTLSGEAISKLAKSESIRSLTVADIVDNEIVALRALGENHVLTSLSLAVNDAHALAPLFQNVTLQILTLSVSRLPASLLSSLAGMLALDSVHIRNRGNGFVLIGADDIRALSAKPLRRLSMYGIEMNCAARSLLAAAQTACLRLQFCTPFESANFAALSENRTITSLLMTSNGGPSNNYEHVLSMVTNGLPQLTSLHVEVGSGTPQVAKAMIQAAWKACGRSSVDLVVDSWYAPANP